MYERFTDRSRKVVALANQIALGRREGHIGDLDLLLAMVRDSSAVGSVALQSLGVDLKQLADAVAKLIPPDMQHVAFGKLPQTPQFKKVIMSAIDIARELGHNWVGTEHMLLGMLAGAESPAGRALMQAGVGADAAREAVLRLAREPERDPPRELPPCESGWSL